MQISLLDFSNTGSGDCLFIIMALIELYWLLFTFGSKDSADDWIRHSTSEPRSSFSCNRWKIGSGNEPDEIWHVKFPIKILSIFSLHCFKTTESVLIFHLTDSDLFRNHHCSRWYKWQRSLGFEDLHYYKIS